MTDTDLTFGDYGAAVTVETGAGLSDADSYISLAEAADRVAKRGGSALWDASGMNDAKRNDMIRAAASGIGLMFGLQWSGVRLLETQALDWPRLGAFNHLTGRGILGDTVPDAVKWAQVEYLMALLNGINPIKTIDPETDSAAFAVSTSDSLPGGFNESRTFSGGGRPALPVLTRLNLVVAPLLCDASTVRLA